MLKIMRRSAGEKLGETKAPPQVRKHKENLGLCADPLKSKYNHN